MASCFCGTSAGRRGQFVKLVFPGGHVELLDRPVLAAEVMSQHPRFCVARPDVFREPVGAVAAPNTMLHLGHKYYVVPKSTVRRLLKPDGHDRGHKDGGKKWFGWAVGGEARAPQRPPQEVGVSHGREEEAATMLWKSWKLFG
uniref:Uncharacterized protein n=1 Tax=Aegilops tauschii TaxID=37682 RepID=R7W0L9_AEGTA